MKVGLSGTYQNTTHLGHIWLILGLVEIRLVLKVFETFLDKAAYTLGQSETRVVGLVQIRHQTSPELACELSGQDQIRLGLFEVSASFYRNSGLI